MAGPSKGIRLSFLAQADQNKYEMVFSQVAGGRDILTAAAAKDVLSRSNIGDENLARIWDLSNVTNQAQLTFPEFATAMYLTSMKMSGSEIPPSLPDHIRNEIRNAVLTIQGNPPPQALVSTMPPMNTGMPNNTQQTSMTGMPNNIQQPLMTGMPNTMQQPLMTGMSPATNMLQNNIAFANRMMPHTTNYTPPSSFESLSKNIKIPWAVTEEEKKQYTKIFKAWDTEKKGTLSGETAKEIFSQSGLAQNVLMQIWALSDPNNQGKLNIDEFSVAMHLIYRKLNGYNVPETLPAELVPPSTRNLNESVDQLKKTILEDIAKKKYLNNFRSTPSDSLTSSPTSLRSPISKKKEIVDDDKDVGYVSSARRMGPDRTRNRDLSGNSSPASSPSLSSYGYRGKQTRIFDLRKEIDEKKKLIQQLEKDSIKRVATPYNELSALDKKDIDSIKERIRELQTEISKTGSEQGYDAWSLYISKTAELSNLADQEKSLEDEVQYMLDVTLRGLLDQVNETEDDLKEKKIQIAQKNSTSAAPADDLPLNIVGTGPNGEITESDRIKAKAKALVAARMNKITGKAPTNNLKAQLDKINQERDEFRFYTDSIEDSLKEMQDGLKAIHLEISMIGLDIRKQDLDQKKIQERAQFEEGVNVAKDVKEFIQELSFDAALAKAPDVDPSFEARFPSF